MKKIKLGLWACAATAVLWTGCAGRNADLPAKTDYAVVISRATLEDPAWRETAMNLISKYNGELLIWDFSPEEIRLELSVMMPKYTCFVTRPEEAGHDFTVKVSRMTRTLDADPYTDTLWGILTGYDAADAKRIADTTEPLIITRALDATGVLDLSPYDIARCYDENHRGKVKLKNENGLRTEDCAIDNTDGVREALIGDKIQFLATSAHATQDNWAMGYRGPNLVMRHHNGMLLTENTKKEQLDAPCPEPKVYLAAGNCLIGDIPRRDCMATAWIHSGGVHQMVGYTVPTWFGFMGWGTLGYFTENPGFYNLTQSFHFNNIRNVMRLHQEYPAFADSNMISYETSKLGSTAYWQFGMKSQHFDKTLIGLLFDRDVVAFYGDPAWDARIRPLKEPAYTVSTIENKKEGRIILHASRDGSWPSNGIFIPLSTRIQNWKITRNSIGAEPVFADNFIYIPITGACQKDEERHLFYTAEPAEDRPTLKQYTEIQPLLRFFAEHNKSGNARDMPMLKKAFSDAGQHAMEIVRGFQLCPDPGSKLALLWSLIDAAPEDLQRCSAEFLSENATYAFKVRQEAPWRDQVSDTLFRDYILPFSCLDESRDSWRKEFYQTFSARAFACRTPSEAAALLNKIVFQELDVVYHATKRPKPNQSPAESIAAKYASCTGLSIILADACRAAGIPARIVGCPLWTDRSGNHNWVEFWDDQWIFEGASSSDPRGNNWVREKVKKATDSKVWAHSVIAAVRRPQGKDKFFQMVWSPMDQRIPAIPITGFYTDDRQETVTLPGPGKTLWISHGGEPVYRLTGNGQKTIYLPNPGNVPYTYDVK